MTDIFSSRPGGVFVHEDSDIPPVSLFVEDFLFLDNDLFCVTSLSYDPAINIQIQHALTGYTYAYVFGGRASPMSLGGVILSRVCPQQDGPFANPHGWNELQQYFDTNNASAHPLPVSLSVGSSGYVGLLVKASLRLDSGENHAGKFQLDLIIPP